MKYFIAIPTYNGGEIWKETVKKLKKNSPTDLHIQIVDSTSTDDTALVAKDAGFSVLTIPGKEFNHGGTRNLAVEIQSLEYDIIIFLTQDAIPEPGFVENIIQVFSDPEIACAYGRQLPHLNANPIAQHARFFNYPEQGHVNSISDVKSLGIKTAFMSNSFSAYRIPVLKELGGFPSNTILCEDMFFTAKAVLSNYKVAYVANAKVRHSHNYTARDEFKRYFDIGVFHADEGWIREKFGGAGGEGIKFIRSEFKYLLKHGKYYIPKSMLNNFMKIIGYKLGLKYKTLPYGLVKMCSMHKRFWK